MITYNSCVFTLLPCKTKSDNTIYKYKYVAEFMKVDIKLWKNEIMKMQWLRWLVACLSQQRSRFDSRSAQVGFVVYRMTLRQASL